MNYRYLFLTLFFSVINYNIWAQYEPEDDFIFEVDGIWYDSSESWYDDEPTVNVISDFWNNEGELVHVYYDGDVVIPETVQHIEDGITITRKVKRIGDYAFEGCTNLTSVVIPNSVTEIRERAFYGCTSLTSVVFGNSVKDIGPASFQLCTSLISLTIPSSVTNIGSGAFNGGASLISLTIGDITTPIGDVTSMADFNSFGFAPLLVNILGPISRINVAVVSGGYPMASRSLESLRIPKTITSIEERSFQWWNTVPNIYCYAENVPSADAEAFHSSRYYRDYYEYKNPDTLLIDTSLRDSLRIIKATLHVPASAIDAYRNTEPWCNFEEIVPIGEPTNIIKLKANYGTFCSNVDLDFTNAEGIKAYIVSSYSKSDDDIILYLTRVYNVPSGTGIIVSGKAGHTYQIPIGDSTATPTNLLIGTTDDISLDTTFGYIYDDVDYRFKNFILANGSSGIGFFPTKGGTLAAGKAYLPIPIRLCGNESDVKGLAMVFDDEGEVTRINEPETRLRHNEIWYSIDGQKLFRQPMRPGMYICNGQKVIIK